MSNCAITVFTPAYNRANTLHRVYESLCSQTFTDFEWIIVDDGSTDNTKDIVEGYKRKSIGFEIRYFYKKNEGKHIATNLAVSVAQGEMFITIDSDDGCKPNALEKLWAVWMSVPEEKRYSYKGVACRCCSIDAPDEVMGTKFPAINEEVYFDSNDNDIRFKYHITGELWGMTRIDVLRENPYPTIAGLHFYPENIYWGRIGKKYKTRYINDPLRFYYIGQNEQVTKKANPKEFYHMREYVVSDLITEGYFKYEPLYFIKQSIALVRDGLYLGKGLKEIYNTANSRLGKFLVVCSAPVGVGLYILKK